MKRSSKYFPLAFIVEVKSTYPFFETMAAFDVAQVALAYAADCKRTNPKNTYRVLERRDTTFKPLTDA